MEEQLGAKEEQKEEQKRSKRGAKEEQLGAKDEQLGGKKEQSFISPLEKMKAKVFTSIFLFQRLVEEGDIEFINTKVYAYRYIRLGTEFLTSSQDKFQPSISL